MNQADAVWVFHGADARFASAVFRERSQAIAWIQRHALSGVLTLYPLDTSVYDWALANGHFEPRSPSQSEARFIGAFSSSAQEHLHFENGRAD